MAKMMGDAGHNWPCDCGSVHVSATGEKCNKKHGNRRQRSREKQTWKQALAADAEPPSGFKDQNMYEFADESDWWVVMFGDPEKENAL